MQFSLVYTDVYCGFWDKPNASVDIKPCPDCMMPTKKPTIAISSNQLHPHKFDA
jgi:hypothetical protein